MENLSELIGWYAFLAAVLACTWYATTAFFRFVAHKGSVNEHVYFTDTVIAACTSINLRSTESKLVLGCTVVVFLLIGACTPYSMFSALGYASITYAIGGIVTPMFMRKVKPLASPSVAPATEEIRNS